MTFTPNRNFLDELAADRDVKAVAEQRANDALRDAQQIARTFVRTGAYAASLQVDGNRLLSTDRAAHLIEFGSRKNRPYAPLRKAADRHGRYVDNR